MQPATKPLRCAIYTRVSTEHGLEQEFNSLDNQREAAEAYIKSQAHEGWRCFYERRSTMVTSNLPFEDWTQVLGSERLTGALLDRLTHHVSILAMNGDSYRLKQSTSRRRSAARVEQNQATEIVNPDTGEITTA